VLFVAVYGIIIYLYASAAQDLFAGVLPQKFKVFVRFDERKRLRRHLSVERRVTRGK